MRISSDDLQQHHGGAAGGLTDVLLALHFVQRGITSVSPFPITERMIQIHILDFTSLSLPPPWPRPKVTRMDIRLFWTKGEKMTS